MFSFIDISGDISSQDENYIVVAGVSVHRQEILSLANTFHSLKRDLLNNEALEIKATDFINKNTLTNKNLNKSKFIDKVLSDIIPVYKISAVVIKNKPIVKKFKSGKLPYHYILLMQRINEIAEMQSKHALIIFDNEARTVDRWTAIAFNNYLFRSERGKQLDRIIEMPIFADSAMTPGLQIADIVAGIIRHYYNRKLDKTSPNSPEEREFKSCFDIVQKHFAKTRKYPSLYVAPDDYIKKNFI